MRIQKPKQHKRANGKGSVTLRCDGYRTKPYMVRAARCQHTPHECRHTLATWFDNVKANAHCVKLILGHAEKDITKGVYTHKTIAQLRKTIDLLA